MAAKKAGVAVQFNPKHRDSRTTVDLSQVTLEQALEVLDTSTGHFHKMLREDAILVLADTPQNRRNHEALAIQTFHLEHASNKEIMSGLRTLLDVKKIASLGDQRSISVRDTEAKVALVGRLIESLDRPPTEIDVTVEILTISDDSLAGAKGQQEGVRRVSLEDLKSWKAKGEAVSREETVLNLLGGEKGTWNVSREETVKSRPDLQVATGLHLTLRASAASSSDAILLTVHVETRTRHTTSGNASAEAPVLASEEVRSRLLLQEGEVYLITDFAPSSSSEDHPSPALLTSKPGAGGSKLVLALMPKVIRQAQRSASEPLLVGTESRIRVR